MTGGLRANQVARISPSSQHRLRLVCFPFVCSEELADAAPDACWCSGVSATQVCVEWIIDHPGHLHKARLRPFTDKVFMDPPRLRSIPLGSGDSSDFQPNQRECHRACGEGTWLRWFLFGGSERRRCCSQCWCSLSLRNEQVSGGHFVCLVAQTVECICHCLTLMTSGHRAADLRAWLLLCDRRLDRRME